MKRYIRFKQDKGECDIMFVAGDFNAALTYIIYISTGIPSNNHRILRYTVNIIRVLEEPEGDIF